MSLYFGGQLYLLLYQNNFRIVGGIGQPWLIFNDYKYIYIMINHNIMHLYKYILYKHVNIMSAKLFFLNTYNLYAHS